HDFRPEYLKLAPLRQDVAAPVIALTATATPAVAAEIVAALALRDPVRIRGPVARPNLRFSVRPVRKESERLDALAEELRALPVGPGVGRALVYGATRAQVERARDYLVANGVRAGAYHAGMRDGDRRRAQ